MILKIFYCARSPGWPIDSFSNGNIPDEHISGEVQFKRLRNSRNLQENRAKVVQIWRLITKLGEVIEERHHYCREFQSINDFILRKLGGMC